jgi:hypothetical protein
MRHKRVALQPDEKQDDCYSYGNEKDEPPLMLHETDSGVTERHKHRQRQIAFPGCGECRQECCVGNQKNRLPPENGAPQIE